MDLLVMENVFYERSLSPVYDLKGSERARWCKDDPNDPTTVLLDENLKRSILSAPLLVGFSPSLPSAPPLHSSASSKTSRCERGTPLACHESSIDRSSAAGHGPVSQRPFFGLSKGSIGQLCNAYSPQILLPIITAHLRMSVMTGWWVAGSTRHCS